MDSKDYIINQLNVFIEKFSKVRVRYEYDEDALVHTIEIVPNEVYHLDKGYIEWESEMFDHFISQYPTENICFISDDALVGIKNVCFIKEGLDYASFSTKQDIVSFNNVNVIIHQKILDKSINFNYLKHNDIIKQPIKETNIPAEYAVDYSQAA